IPAALRVAPRLLAQGSPAWGSLAGEDARALFTGVAAHTISQMPSLVAAGAGLMLATLAHAVGWPIPVGGSQAIPDALVADLRAHGGELVLGEEVTEPPSGVVLYDTSPTALLQIYGDRLPAGYAAKLRRYRYGPGVAKVDFVLSGEIPWVDSRLAEAPTLHLGGDRATMALAEKEIAAGRHA
ncbi:dehydrogenase, partial [Mycobacterium sp. ITM-2017-0098]